MGWVLVVLGFIKKTERTNSHGTTLRRTFTKITTARRGMAIEQFYYLELK